MMAFVSARLGLGHKDFDGYRDRLRSTSVSQRTTKMAFVATNALSASRVQMH